MIEGMDRIKSAMQSRANQYEKDLQEAGLLMAQAIVAGARRRLYQNLKYPKSHSPLAQNIRLEAEGGDLKVITDKAYARFVEFGTRTMPARPFLTPATEEVKVSYSEFFNNKEAS